MIISEKGRALIKGYEKCKLTAYLPTPNDRWTVGWGCTGPNIGPETVWTQKQADDAFAVLMATYSDAVTKLLGGRPTTQCQFDAMVSLAYNIGTGAFGKSTLLSLHKMGAFEEAAKQFPRWNRQAGAVLNGLTKRRASERELYLS